MDAVRHQLRVFRQPGQHGYGENVDYATAVSAVPVFAADALALRLDDLDIG